MQVGILRQLRDGVAVTAKVVQVLQAARAAALRMFFLRHMSLIRQCESLEIILEGLSAGMQFYPFLLPAGVP
jgi:hypothetical protein